MTNHLLTPCPTCGRRFDFPLTGCVTGVAEQLLASSGGKCPNCGTPVVVDQLPPELAPRDELALARTVAEVRCVKIVDLGLSVRCRRDIVVQLGMQTVGDVLDSGRERLAQELGGSSLCFEQLCQLLRDHNIHW